MKRPWKHRIKVDYSRWPATLSQKTGRPAFMEADDARKRLGRTIELLRTIEKYETGKAVYEAISRSSKMVSIVSPLNVRVDNAKAEPVNHANATRQGRHVRKCDTVDPRKPLIRGTGKGSDVTVEFIPGPWPTFRSGYTGCRPRGCKPGRSLDELLFHELVHAARIVHGKTLCLKMGGKYDTEEEFFAILVTNIFLSEKGRQGLRADHHSYEKMKDPARRAFYRTHERLLQKFRHQQPRFVRRLSQVKTGYNPLRRLLKERSMMWDSSHL